MRRLLSRYNGRRSGYPETRTLAEAESPHCAAHVDAALVIVFCRAPDGSANNQASAEMRHSHDQNEVRVNLVDQRVRELLEGPAADIPGKPAPDRWIPEDLRDRGLIIGSELIPKP